MGLLDGGDLVASFATLSGQPVFRPSRYPFADRVAAAARAGFAGIGMSVDDFDLVRAGGVAPEGMREILGEHRIEIRAHAAYATRFAPRPPHASCRRGSRAERRVSQASRLAARGLARGLHDASE